MGRHSHRAPSVADSMAEYFDASEVIVCETSSEAEASDESGLSDITTTSTSEPEEGHSECWPTIQSLVAHWSYCPPLKHFLCKERLKIYHLLYYSAAATINYRASLNSAPNKPSPVPTNTGNTILLSSHFKSECRACRLCTAGSPVHLPGLSLDQRWKTLLPDGAVRGSSARAQLFITAQVCLNSCKQSFVELQKQTYSWHLVQFQ